MGGISMSDWKAMLSAPAGELFKQFGFTVENVVATAKKVLK